MDNASDRAGTYRKSLIRPKISRSSAAKHGGEGGPDIEPSPPFKTLFYGRNQKRQLQVCFNATALANRDASGGERPSLRAIASSRDSCGGGRFRRVNSRPAPNDMATCDPSARALRDLAFESRLECPQSGKAAFEVGHPMVLTKSECRPSYWYCLRTCCDVPFAYAIVWLL